MLGAIIGDIVGSRYEFNPTNNFNFKMFASGSNFTDDTICTIAVADALLRGRDYGESIHEWCRKYPNPKGCYGGRFYRWVMSSDPRPYGSFGNGSAMRVSPIGWWFFDTEEVMSQAAMSAECSHNHPEGIKGACTVAFAIAMANNMKKANGKVDVEALLEECVKVSGYDIDIKKSAVENRFDETCQGSVPVALWIIGESNSFEDALRRAVSLGADADTLGAIVGGIAEAIWGIPQWMKKKALTYLTTEMKDVLYGFRRCVGERRKVEADNEKLRQMQAIRLWKLGLGNMAKFFNGENPLPSKEIVATKESFNTEPWPEDSRDWSLCDVELRVPREAMKILRKGHIPEAMEDHWMMYAEGEYIRYYRSWTGTPAFEAHYMEIGDGYMIDSLRINHALSGFGVTGNLEGIALFNYLIVAEVGGDTFKAWDEYLRVSGLLPKEKLKE